MDPATQQQSATVACLNCRDRHVKCDGNLSGCARCETANISCYFLPSRRGRRPRPGLSLADFQSLTPSPMDMSLAAPTGETVSNDLYSFVVTPDFVVADATTPASTQPGTSYSYGGTHLVTLYYLNSHHAHPFLLPREAFLQSSPPSYLINIVELIGLHYISPALVTTDRITQLQTVVQDAVLNLEKVQALLLLSITQHGYTLPEAARECLGQAIDGSLQLGLHCRDAADAEMVQSAVHAESVRRTWWEVVIVDTLLATVQVEGALQLTLEEIPNVMLPCEQEEYEAGCIDLSLVSARDLGSSRHLFYDNDNLSSSAHRVEAAIILRRCLLTASQASVDALDATISAWFHRLPPAKRAILGHNGGVDQMAFQAVMLMHCASIYLHFPRSHLVTALPVTSHIFCSAAPGVLWPFTDPQVHTAKALNAATSLSKLGSLSTSVTDHSPFFCCVLVLSSIIQVAIRSSGLLGSSGSHHFLGLNFGVLKSMGEIWKIAAVSRPKIRDVAMEVEGALERSNRRIEDIFSAH